MVIIYLVGSYCFCCDVLFAMFLCMFLWLLGVWITHFLIRINSNHSMLYSRLNLMMWKLSAMVQSCISSLLVTETISLNKTTLQWENPTIASFDVLDSNLMTHCSAGYYCHSHFILLNIFTVVSNHCLCICAFYADLITFLEKFLYSVLWKTLSIETKTRPRHLGAKSETKAEIVWYQDSMKPGHKFQMFSPRLRHFRMKSS